MSRTTIKEINFKTLKTKNNTSPIIIKLMMACNDLQRANKALAYFKKTKSNSKHGSAMYFTRLQISHLFEGFKISEKKLTKLLMKFPILFLNS